MNLRHLLEIFDEDLTEPEVQRRPADNEYNEIEQWARGKSIKLDSLGVDDATNSLHWHGIQTSTGNPVHGEYDLSRHTNKWVDSKTDVGFDDSEMAEGFNDSSLQAILDRHADAYQQLRNEHTFDSTPEMDAFYEELFNYFVDTGDMPYGTMKARDGDPYEWIADKILNMDDDNPIKHEDTDPASGYADATLNNVEREDDWDEHWKEVRRGTDRDQLNRLIKIRNGYIKRYGSDAKSTKHVDKLIQDIHDYWAEEGEGKEWSEGQETVDEAPIGSELVDLVWGTNKAKTMSDKWERLTSLDWLFGDASSAEDHLRFSAAHTVKRLKQQGFDNHEIHRIRDAVTQAMKAAVLWGQRRFDIAHKDIRTSPDSFGVWQLSWDVRPEVAKQVNKMARNLVARKLDKQEFGEPATEEAVGAPNNAVGGEGSGEDDDADERFAKNLERTMGKELTRANPAEIKAAKQKLDAMREGKNMKTTRTLKEDTSINTLNVSMDVSSHGPADTLELLRKLSGLPAQAPMGAPMGAAPAGIALPPAEPMPGITAAPEVPQDDFVDLSPFDDMPDDSDMDNDFAEPDVDVDMEPDMDAGMDAPMGEPEVEPTMEPGMDAGMDEPMGEPEIDEPNLEMEEADENRDHSNSPHEETFSASAHLNQGGDLNRKKGQYAKEYPGDNRMASVAEGKVKKLSEDLYRKYVNSILESLTETDVTDDEDRKYRCQEIGRLKQDQKAMMDPATRANVLQKWNELRCDG